MRPGGLGLLAGLFLASLALRPQLVGIGPLVPEIQDDLAVSHAVAGLLGTLPILCMGLFAPPAPYLSRRYGSRAAIAACLAAVAVFGIARTVAPGAALVILLTFGVGVGMGFAQTFFPVAVKERFPHRPAFATGLYVTGIQTGSTISAAIAVPVADAAGGWRASLLAFSAFTALLVPVWLWLTRRQPPHARSEASLPRLPWRSALAWRLVAIWAVMGVIYYGLHAWLPDSYVERGWSEQDAGALLAVINVATLLPSLAVAGLADRVGSRRAYLVGAAVLMLGGLLGVVLLPSGAWVWAAVIGTANGALFAMSLTLPLDLAERPADVGAIVGMMLGGGYTLAALAPLVLGAVRDASGSYTTSLWLIAGAAAALLALCAPLSRERLRRAAGRPATL